MSLSVAWPLLMSCDIWLSWSLVVILPSTPSRPTRMRSRSGSRSLRVLPVTARLARFCRPVAMAVLRSCPRAATPAPRSSSRTRIAVLVGGSSELMNWSSSTGSALAGAVIGPLGLYTAAVCGPVVEVDVLLAEQRLGADVGGQPTVQGPVVVGDLQGDQGGVVLGGLDSADRAHLGAGLEHVAARDQPVGAREADLQLMRAGAGHARHNDRSCAGHHEQDGDHHADDRRAGQPHSCQSMPSGPSPEALKNWWTNSSSDSSISCLLPKWRIFPL